MNHHTLKDHRRVLESLSDHTQQIFAEGIILTLLGIAAVVVPSFMPASIGALNIFLGWLFVVGGLIGVVTTVGGRHEPGFWWSSISAILALAVGMTLIELPAGDSPTLTYLLVIFFAIEGIATIMFALEHKKKIADSGRWMVASGIVDLLLSVVSLIILPRMAQAVAGFLIGINMMFGGVALIAMAAGHGKVRSQSELMDPAAERREADQLTLWTIGAIVICAVVVLLWRTKAF